MQSAIKSPNTASSVSYGTTTPCLILSLAPKAWAKAISGEAQSLTPLRGKLPRGFLIPTPVGDYNPDWAISFKAGSVRHIYFVAETKGTMSSMKLREIEKTKIECARKFFDEINQRISVDHVRYDVVTDYGKLMELVT